MQAAIAILGVLAVVVVVRKNDLDKLQTLERDKQVAAANARAEEAILGQRQLAVSGEELTNSNLRLGISLEEERVKRLGVEQRLADLRELSALADQAEAGSRPAYEKLLEMSRSASYLRDRATERVTFINRKLAFYEQPPGVVLALDLSATIDGRSVRIAAFPTAQLFKFLEDEAITENTRFSVINDICTKPENEIAREALAMLKSSRYLPAVAATCTILRRTFTKDIPFMDVVQWQEFLQRRFQTSKTP